MTTATEPATAVSDVAEHIYRIEWNGADRWRHAVGRFLSEQEPETTEPEEN